MDDKREKAIIGSIVIGGLSGAGIATAIAITSGQTVGSFIGMVIGFTISGAVVGNILNHCGAFTMPD